jgi:hypothetical protein
MSSCLQIDSDRIFSEADFFREIYSSWIYANKVENIRHMGKIDRPQGIEINLLNVTVIDSSMHTYRDCLYYKVPFKDRLGELKLLRIKEGDCPLVSSDEALIKLDRINELNLSFNKYLLELNIIRGKNNFKWSIPFHNLYYPSKHRPFFSESENKLLPGIHFVKPGNFENSTLIGKKENRYSLNNTSVCFNTDSECNNVGENNCYRCRFGQFRVVDYRCPKKPRKFCGISHCGEKNEPACPRGEVTDDPVLDGICNEGLSPFLDSNKILICQ